MFWTQSGETMKSLCSNWCHGCERLYFEQSVTWDLSLRLQTDPTQNKYKKIVVLKLMLLLIEANHKQSIERRIFISQPVETTDVDKYANNMFKNDCFIDLQGVSKNAPNTKSLLN